MGGYANLSKNMKIKLFLSTLIKVLGDYLHLQSHN